MISHFTRLEEMLGLTPRWGTSRLQMDKKLRKSLIANRIRMCAACGEPIMLDEIHSTGDLGTTHLECALDPRDLTITTPININD